MRGNYLIEFSNQLIISHTIVNNIYGSIAFYYKQHILRTNRKVVSIHIANFNMRYVLKSRIVRCDKASSIMISFKKDKLTVFNCLSQDSMIKSTIFLIEHLI